ncbi:hypothetical protein DEJ32_03890 [Curtobacterium sp. MCPF17_046]|nr:hypothetical protein DEJ32_03890 [Curtobacterium sp. MCPF17_046]
MSEMSIRRARGARRTTGVGDVGDRIRTRWSGTDGGQGSSSGARCSPWVRRAPEGPPSGGETVFGGFGSSC